MRALPLLSAPTTDTLATPMALRGRDVERLVSTLLLAATVFLVARPFFVVDWYDNDEVDRYPGRLEVLFQHMRLDNPWPRWIPELAGGHGYPLFDFFNPMVLLFALPFRALGSSPQEAMKLAMVILLVQAAVHTKLLGERLYGRWAGTLGAVLFLTAPYTISNLYTRGDLAEAGAMLLFPAVLYHYLAYVETTRRRHFFGMAIGYALLVPMHAFSAMMFTHVFAVVWVAMLVRDVRRGVRTPRRHLEAAAACALGILCASFYWLPVFAEMRTVSIDSLFTMEAFDAFAIPVYGVFVRNYPGPVAERIVTVGPLLWGFFLLGLADRGAGKRGDARAWLTAIFVGVVVFGCVMSTNVSLPLYRVLFWFERIAFPWRWLSLVSLAAALVGGRALMTLARTRPAMRLPLVVALSCLALVTTWPDAVLTRPMEIGADHWAYAERGPRESILFDYGEFYPSTVRVRPGPEPRPYLARPGCEVRDYGESDRAIRFEVEGEAPCEVIVTQFAWITWRATMDGAPLALDVDAQGRMRVRVPEGAHEVHIDWVPTLAQRSGERLTMLGALLLIVALVLAIALPRRRALVVAHA